MIKPVLRYPGSKFRKLNKIFSFIPNDTQYFYDLFGGSGIVGVNACFKKELDVIINDYDKVLNPITDSFVLRNMLSFQGLGKTFTKSALTYFLKRERNGYWEKLKKYNEILKKCKIINKDIFDIEIQQKKGVLFI